MFSDNIKKLREEAGLTQDEFAEKIFVTRTAVSKWENGKSYPSIDSLKVISELFGVSIDNLILDEELERFSGFVAKKPKTFKEFISNTLSDMKLIFKSDWVKCTILMMYVLPISSLIFLDEPINYFKNLKEEPLVIAVLIYASIKLTHLKIQLELKAPVVSAIAFATLQVLTYYGFLYIISL